MTKLTKGILLFTALLLPVLIFVFLKMFGNNQFDIPVFNHTELSAKVNCTDINLPHVVGNNEGALEPMEPSRTVNIYHVMDDGIKSEEMKGLMVVKDRLTGSDALIHSIGALDSLTDLNGLRQTYQIGGIWELHQMAKDQLVENINCQLMITEGESLVLVDDTGRIRGYYAGSDEEEIDRLVLEAKILIYGNEQGRN
jgi:protein SCO1/2